MDERTAKELLHVRDWLRSVEDVTARGRDAYLAEALLQEAGDSLMMKIGEAANRLSKRGVTAPDGVEWDLAIANRNFLIHQYDVVNRSLTWQTLDRDLPTWRDALEEQFRGAERVLRPPS